MNIILKIARRSRREIEHFAERLEDGPANGCPEYLDCFCAIATDLFVRTSNTLGFKVDFIEGTFGALDNFPNHCWALYNKKIIDLTATQFDKKQKVYVVDSKNPEYEMSARGEDAYKSLKSQWPEDQAPFRYNDAIASMSRNILKRITQ